MGTSVIIMLVLFLAAMVLFLVEILTPFFGLMGLLGLGALIAGIVQAYAISTLTGHIALVASIVGLPAYLSLLVKLLPNTPLGKRIFLGEAADGSGQGTPEAAQLQQLVGKAGTAESFLRPTGAIRIEGKRFIAVAESGTIPKDTPVEVIAARATEVVVRPKD